MTNINLPNRYSGYIFSIIFLLYEINTLDNPKEWQLALLIIFISWSFLSYTVYQIHKAMNVLYNNQYKIKPFWAAIAHFIPIFNLYWIYKWPKEIADYVWYRDKHYIYDQKKIPWLMYSGVLLMRFDFAIGFALSWTAILIVIKGIEEYSSNLLRNANPINFNR